MAKKAKKNNKRQNKKKQDKAKKRKDKQKQLRLDNKAKSIAERRQQALAHNLQHHHHHHDGVPCNHDHSQDFASGLWDNSPAIVTPLSEDSPLSFDDFDRVHGQQDPGANSSQMLYSDEPVAFTLETFLMATKPQVLGDTLKKVVRPIPSDSFETVATCIKDCLENVSIIANAIINRWSEVNKAQKFECKQFLRRVMDSQSMPASTRSYVAAKLVQLGESKYQQDIDEQFPLSSNTEHLPSYKKLQQLLIACSDFLGLIESAFNTAYSWHPKSPEHIDLCNLILNTKFLEVKTQARACAKLLQWDSVNDLVIERIEELEGSPDVEEQLHIAFLQSYLAEKKHEFWTSERILNSQSAMVRLMGRVYKTYDKDADPKVVDEMIAIWSQMDDENHELFFRSFLSPPETDLFRKFLDQASLLIHSEEALEECNEVWSIWGVDPSPELMKRLGWDS